MEDKGNNPVGSGDTRRFGRRFTAQALVPTIWVKPWRRSEIVKLGGR